MNEQQINEKFSMLNSGTPVVQSWADPANAGARKAFVQAMRGRQYGYDALLDAWNWFLHGWSLLK